MAIDRRHFLTAASAAALTAVGGGAGWAAGGAEDLVAQAGLSGEVSYLVADLKSGLVLESRNPNLGMPPASTAKAITSLYALETLGPEYRFRTRVIATGPVRGGTLEGDLVLAGGGDPTLSTDDLGDLAARLVAKGVRAVRGRLLVWGGALPYAAQIAGDQPVYVSYNPSVSGLILNFNRVYFEWRRAGSGYQLGMDARGERFQPRAYSTDVALAQRQSPLFTYSEQGGKEHWTVAAGALGRGGSRWLPVRHPELYAGDVFQTLARAQGLDLPAPQPVSSMPRGEILVERGSDPLGRILVDMLKYSTNVTAEAVGMTTSVARGAPAALGRSGASMSGWLTQRLGGGGARFVDHSGLGAETRISASEMVHALAALGPRVGLRGLMKGFKLRDDDGKILQNQSLRVDAKTGTLNFVSSLAGYMTAPDGTELVFAIFTGDLARRRAAAQVEQPAGGRDWVRRSKILQSRLIERWAALYG